MYFWREEVCTIGRIRLMIARTELEKPPISPSQADRV
jgi:hypothetical protein